MAFLLYLFLTAGLVIARNEPLHINLHIIYIYIERERKRGR